MLVIIVSDISMKGDCVCGQGPLDFEERAPVRDIEGQKGGGISRSVNFVWETSCFKLAEISHAKCRGFCKISCTLVADTVECGGEALLAAYALHVYKPLFVLSIGVPPSLGPAGINRIWVRRTYRLGGLSAGWSAGLKSSLIRPPPFVHTQGGTHKTQSVATAGVMLFKGPQARWYTQKAVHTQGGTHQTRFVATAGVMLFKGPRARRYTPKVVHTQGGTHKTRSVAPAGVLLFKGCGGLAPASSEAS